MVSLKKPLLLALEVQGKERIVQSLGLPRSGQLRTTHQGPQSTLPPKHLSSHLERFFSVYGAGPAGYGFERTKSHDRTLFLQRMGRRRTDPRARDRGGSRWCGGGLKVCMRWVVYESI